MHIIREFFDTENVRGPHYGLSTRTSCAGRVMNSQVIVVVLVDSYDLYESTATGTHEPEVSCMIMIW